jgi:hypothetical protein
MQAGKVALKRKTPTKIGFIDSNGATLPNSHSLGIAVEHELDAERESGAVRKARRPTLIFFKEISKNRQNPCHVFDANFDL